MEFIIFISPLKFSKREQDGAKLVKQSEMARYFGLSGFYKEDLSDLIEFTSRNGLIPLYSSSENNWAILILKYANNDV